MISIIIITLNEEKYIAHLLSDIIKQTQEPKEIILVDGRSSDKTIAVAKKFDKKIPLKILTCTKKGPSPARNLGAKEAKGDILMFLDADMRIIDKEFMKKIKKLVGEKKHKVIFPNIKIENANFREKCAEVLMNFATQIGKLIHMPGARAGCMIIQKNIFTRVKGFNESLKIAEDVDLVRKLKKQTKLHYAHLTLYESNRRYRELGVLRTLWVWTKSGIMIFFKKNPGSYKTIR